MNPKSTHSNRKHIVSALFTAQLPNVPEINSVKYHTHNQFIKNAAVCLVNFNSWITHLRIINKNKTMWRQSVKQ